MTPTEIEIIGSAIKTKLELMDTMSEQMAPYTKDGTLKDNTLKHFYTAREALTAAWVKLEAGELEDAIYFLMRGCWNIGEFLAMSKADRAAVLTIPTPN